MFDVLAFPDPEPCPIDARLRAPVKVGRHDETEFVCLGHVVHLGRRRRCGWHLTLHREPGGLIWTHLYRVVPEHGAHVTVMLDRACPGDGRRVLRAETLQRALSMSLPPSDPRSGLRG